MKPRCFSSRMLLKDQDGCSAGLLGPHKALRVPVSESIGEEGSKVNGDHILQ